MNKILVVDDDQSILKVMKMRLEVNGYYVIAKSTAKDALQISQTESFDMALLDYRLGNDNGVELMEKILKTNPELPVIILTAHGTIQTAVEAMKKGAYSFLTKPFDDASLLTQVNNCMEKSTLTREIEKWKNLAGKKYAFDNIIRSGGDMEMVLDKVAMAAETDSTVYIEGESGTGKELIAKTLHMASPRKNGPFIAINCGAIPETLFESELFGYEKGAFTGASRNKKGYFALANDGTFFLDEISEMPLSMQVKMLRVLQESEFYPLGSSTKVKLNVRLIAASNTNLSEEVQNGNFREDLFYRIHVIPISLPPLRDRKDSIPLLADHFIKEFNEKMQKEITGVEKEGISKLMAYSWPGNVRELKNAIEYAMAMTPSGLIPEDLILQTHSFERITTEVEKDQMKPLKEAKQDFEKDYIVRLLEATKGNISQASKLAGKYRADFYDLMKKHSLKADDFRKK